MWKKKNLPKKSIVITIDDGDDSVFYFAIPILKKYNIKATTYMITARPNINKIKQYQSILDFESHSHNMHKGGCPFGHGGITRCVDYEKGLADLKQSIALVGSHSSFAYPFLDTTDSIYKIVKDAGFNTAVTTVNRRAKVGDDPLLLPRVRMSTNISLSSFIKLVSRLFIPTLAITFFLFLIGIL